MKKSLLVCAALLLVFFLAACKSGQPSSSSSKSSDARKGGVPDVQKYVDEINAMHEEPAEPEEEEVCEGVDPDLVDEVIEKLDNMASETPIFWGEQMEALPCAQAIRRKR